ncbi:hypothetical protein [Clostridium scatologenes]|uniref:Uncharacterized protein n=1 Tax=Clostridium scatologenes TaxID=1548 RepID=A0A0E3M7M0_CLOSL|nr:hypothetical protein [Clostridium scatologenes]AKA70509.1 hypothetical protein CSCA_3384 [Clostridium scatologenes]
MYSNVEVERVNERSKEELYKEYKENNEKVWINFTFRLDNEWNVPIKVIKKAKELHIVIPDIEGNVYK